MKRLILLITFLVVSLLSQSQNTIKILLIGSSHGRNTIGQFPVLASHSGFNVICGNAYKGGLRIQSVANMCLTGENFPELYSKFYDGKWHDKNPAQMSILDMLHDEEWDIISIQRAAAEDRYWNENQTQSLEIILNYIRDNCSYSPTIVFNSGFADSYSIEDREKQQKETEDIWNSVQYVKEHYKIDIIPMAPIIQSIRNNDELAGLGSYSKHMLSFDSQHLDLGIGMYASACVCYDFFLRQRYGKKVIDCQYLPTFDDISYGYVESKFTPIEEKYAKMIREIVDDYYTEKETVNITPPMIIKQRNSRIYSISGYQNSSPSNGIVIMDGKKVWLRR